MPERWVVNASPLIVLAKIQQQALLAQLADSLVVPQAVVYEIDAGPPNDPARLFLSTGPLPVVTIAPDPAVLAWDLGAGESAVLSYALHNPGWQAVVDDAMARRCARTLDIPLLGTLAVILRARQAGLIPAAAPLLKALQAAGFRLDDQLIRTALAQTVGEPW
jgi:predicted nucleic acid-binding protein